MPKDFGGLGIINTRTFNDAIILKWAWRLLVDREEDVCCQLLKTKYCRNRPFINSKGGVDPNSGKVCRESDTTSVLVCG